MKTENQKAYAAFYGNTVLLKSHCEDCRRESIVIDDKLACCGKDCEVSSAMLKRISNPPHRRRKPSPTVQRKILDNQRFKCVYCGFSFGSETSRSGQAVEILVVWDHFVPFAFAQNNRHDNFHASCQICNSIKSDKIFDSVEDARTYILNRRKEKGYEDDTMRLLQKHDGIGQSNKEVLLKHLPDKSQYLDGHPGEAEKALRDRQASGGNSGNESDHCSQKDSSKRTKDGKGLRKNRNLPDKPGESPIDYAADANLLEWLKMYLAGNPGLSSVQLALQIGISRTAFDAYLKQTYFLSKEKNGLGVKDGTKIEAKIKEFKNKTERLAAHNAESETKTTALSLKDGAGKFDFHDDKGNKIVELVFENNRVVSVNFR